MRSPLPTIRSSPAARPGHRRGLPRSARRRLLAGLTLLTLMRAGEVLAGEQSLPPVGDWRPELQRPPAAARRPADLTALPSAFKPLDWSAAPLVPPDTFRPLGRSMLEKDAALGGPPEAPFIPSATVWQRLSEYRTRDRVRLLTLWETGGNSVSLQANHRGDATLQWTSRLAGRGGATHGILDELFAKSLRAVMGRGTRDTPRSSPADSGTRSERPPDAVKVP